MPKAKPARLEVDGALLKPYLDYSHWTLMEAAYLLCRQPPRNDEDFRAHEMKAGGPVGHMYGDAGKGGGVSSDVC